MFPNSVFEETQARTGNDNRLVAWSGLSLYIPAAWDARISGHRHLVFENDFQPQLQVRWEKLAHHSPRHFKKKLTKFADQMGSIIPENVLPTELEPLRNNFSLVTCYQDSNGLLKGGVCLCPDCHTLLLFQLLSADPAFLEEICSSLITISCQHHSEILWRIQDFSLALPVSFTLKDYTFGAGLTRLSFGSSDIFLQTCTLGPADTRLSQQTLVEIFNTLSGSPDLELVIGKDNNSCEGYRGPTIPKQIFFRLRREKPFIRAKIWHDTVNNRLLAVVLSSNRPIPLTTTHKICSQYEIVQKKDRT